MLYSLFKFRIGVNKDCQYWAEYLFFHGLKIGILSLNDCRMNKISF